MNEIVKAVCLSHDGFDKLKYNLSYYRSHMAAKKAYNKIYYQNNKDKWKLKGSGSESAVGPTERHKTKEEVREEATKEADKKGLSGPAKSAFIDKYVKEHFKDYKYDFPIGPTNRKKSKLEETASKIASETVPGFKTMYGGSIYRFLDTYRRVFRKTINFIKDPSSATSGKSSMSTEDMINTMKDINTKVSDMERKINDTKNNIYKFVREILSI